MIVQITIDKKIQLQEGSIRCYTFILLTEVLLKSFLNFQYKINLFYVVIFTFYYKNGRNLLHLRKKQNNFSKINSQIQTLDIISKIPKMAVQSCLLIPIYGFEQLFIEENDILKKFIRRCKSCKLNMFNTIMILCEHDRYCNDFAQMIENFIIVIKTILQWSDFYIDSKQRELWKKIGEHEKCSLGDITSGSVLFDEQKMIEQLTKGNPIRDSASNTHIKIQTHMPEGEIQTLPEKFPKKKNKLIN
ncbi:unnamed protein product [Paramecium sonneborni]|uniref:Uncharacterized protein n=1 Tax=Paramecium sonneborni TaxID=65129 RepID=A0A8S1QXZ2_9CILI|nr:unnamed protein product [Paramecium sonneborni]